MDRNDADESETASDIKHPTDIDLLKQCREHYKTAKTEEALNILAIAVAGKLRRWLLRFFKIPGPKVVFSRPYITM